MTTFVGMDIRNADEGEENLTDSIRIWILIPARPLTCCMTSGKRFPLLGLNEGVRLNQWILGSTPKCFFSRFGVAPGEVCIIKNLGLFRDISLPFSQSAGFPEKSHIPCLNTSSLIYWPVVWRAEGAWTW